MSRRRPFEVSLSEPSWMVWPGAEMSWTRFSARPSASATRLAVTPAPDPLIAVTIELSVVAPSIVSDWPLMRKLPGVTL